MLYLVLEWDKYKQKLNYCTNNNKFCQASENQDYIKRETETLLSVSLIINLITPCYEWKRNPKIQTLL